MSIFKRSILLFFNFLIVLSLFVGSACAAESYTGSTTFWDQMLLGLVHGTDSMPFLGDVVQGIAGAFGGGVCSGSSDGLHHSNSVSGDKVYEDSTGSFAYGTCTYCGDRFKIYSKDLEVAYNAGVSTIQSDLGTTTLQSDGSFYLDLPIGYLRVAAGAQEELLSDPSTYISFGDDPRPGELTAETYSAWFEENRGTAVEISGSLDSLSISAIDPVEGSTNLSIIFFRFYPSSNYAPVAGTYTFVPRKYSSFSVYYYSKVARWETNTNTRTQGNQWLSTSAVYHAAGDPVWVSNGLGYSDSFGYAYSKSYTLSGYPSYRYLVVPDTNPLTTYSLDSRVGSIEGDYGIIGDNGQITKVDTTSIVNETNNTYTNPVTGTTSTITDWSYDYSDRSYKLTLDSGDTSTVTYGDEYITIKEGDTVSYVYYYVDPAEVNPDSCKHEYASTTDQAATCTVAGKVTYTCSLCGDIYSESIPATGHTWTVARTVTTTYDDDGNLVQQGYTLYECSVCGEQYKDSDGTGPPSGGSGGSSSGEDDKESIWDKLGSLLGSVLGGILGLLEAVIGKVLDALIALVEMIGEKLAAVVEVILDLFDVIPGLFSGFLSFLTTAFSFFPEDILILLTFGIAVIVVIGIIKAIRR